MEADGTQFGLEPWELRAGAEAAALAEYPVSSEESPTGAPEGSGNSGSNRRGGGTRVLSRMGSTTSRQQLLPHQEIEGGGGGQRGLAHMGSMHSQRFKGEDEELEAPTTTAFEQV